MGWLDPSEFPGYEQRALRHELFGVSTPVSTQSLFAFAACQSPFAFAEQDVFRYKESGRNPAFKDLPSCCGAELRVTSESAEDFDSFLNLRLKESQEALNDHIEAVISRREKEAEKVRNQKQAEKERKEQRKKQKGMVSSRPVSRPRSSTVSYTHLTLPTILRV